MKDLFLSPQKIHKLGKKYKHQWHQRETDEPCSFCSKLFWKTANILKKFFSLCSADLRMGQVLGVIYGKYNYRAFFLTENSTKVLTAAHQNWLSWLQNFQGLPLHPPPTTSSKATPHFSLISHWQLNIKLWLFLIPQANTQKKKVQSHTIQELKKKKSS